MSETLHQITEPVFAGKTVVSIMCCIIRSTPPPPRHKVEGSEIQQAALQKKRVLAQKAANDFSVDFVIGGRGVRNKE